MSVVTILDAKDVPAPRSRATRPRRINGRGEVYCHNCKRYRPTYEFRRHPSVPSRWWPYCNACCRELDRMRWTGERRKRLNAQRVVNKQRARRSEFATRRADLTSGIALLRRRGLTLTDIGEICQLSREGMGNWAPIRVSKPLEAVAIRIGELVALTIDWPLTETPAYRRRTPHPLRDELRAALRPVVLAHPVRQRWHTYEEQRRQAA